MVNTPHLHGVHISAMTGGKDKLPHANQFPIE